MIGYLRGKMILVENQSVIIDVSGIGYQVFLAKSDLDRCVLEEECKLFIHTNVKEDAIELFGFFTAEQKEFFLLLNSVNGVGKKTAMNILSYASLKDLAFAIAEANIALLSSIPGIGKKTAERIALELKDKVSKIALSQASISGGSKISSLTQAMTGLGYTREQSQRALKNIEPKEIQDLPLEDLLRKTINILSGNKIL